MMVCCQVVGNDAAVAMGGLGGIGSLLDLNVAMPVMAANTLDSITLLANASEVFRVNLVEGLEPDEPRCAALIEGSLAMCTSLAPVIGYDHAAAIAKEAFATGQTVRQIAMQKNVLPKDELDRLLDARRMTEPEG